MIPERKPSAKMPRDDHHDFCPTFQKGSKNLVNIDLGTVMCKRVCEIIKKQDESYWVIALILLVQIHYGMLLICLTCGTRRKNAELSVNE